MGLQYLLLIPILLCCWFTLPEYKTNSGRKIINIQVEHPRRVSAKDTERELTRILENLLIDLPGLKEMQSETSSGRCSITIHIESDNLAATVSWIHRRIRLRRAQLPDGFVTPIIMPAKLPTELIITGELAGAPEKVSELIRFLRINGREVVLNNPSPTIISTISPDYDSFYEASNELRHRNEYNGIFYSTKPHTFFTQDVARPKSMVYYPHVDQANASFFVDGQPALTVEIFGNPSSLGNEIKKWPGYSRFKDFLEWETPPLLLTLPYIRAILATSILFLLFIKRDLVMLYWSICSSVLIVSLHITNTPESANFFATALALLPVCLIKSPPKYGKSGSFRLVAIHLLIIASILTFSDEAIHEIPRSTHWTTITEMPATSAVGVSNGKNTGGLVSHLLKDLRKLRQPFVLKTKGENIEAVITSATLSQDKIRAFLVRQAINSSGFWWYVDAPGQADFSTFPQPVYPSEQWTLSGPDYLKLFETGRDLLNELKLHSGVYNARILGSDENEVSRNQFELMDHNAMEAVMISPPDEMTDLHNGLYLSSRTKRGRDIFSPSLPESMTIRKNDRAFLLTIGHEFRGSQKARKKLEQKIQAYLSQNLGKFERLRKKEVVEISIQALIKKLILISIPLFIVLSIISPAYLKHITHICESMGSVILGALITSKIQIGLPVSPEYFFYLVFGTLLILQKRGYRFEYNLVWTALTILISLFLFPPIIGWALVSGGIFSLPPIIRLVQRSISRVFSPLLLWHGLQSSRMN